MFTSVRPITLRRFPSRSGASWPCTDCGRAARIAESWTVEVETVDGRRFCIVLCGDCAKHVEGLADRQEPPTVLRASA